VQQYIYSLLSTLEFGEIYLEISTFEDCLFFFNWRANSRIKSNVTSFRVAFVATRKCRKQLSAQLVFRTWLACSKVRFVSLNFLYISDWHVTFLHTIRRKLLWSDFKVFPFVIQPLEYVLTHD
jgi:hypothetical protein